MSLAVGTELPEVRVPLTRTMIVATALATRDFQDVHHDPDLAVERGSKDIFMNILTTNGILERYVRSWAGPAAVLRGLRIRLGVPNYAGDAMTLTGEVADLEVGDQRDRVTVTVRGTNSLGDHVTGTAVLDLPHDLPQELPHGMAQDLHHGLHQDLHHDTASGTLP
jgi:acyl dehydratase